MFSWFFACDSKSEYLLLEKKQLDQLHLAMEIVGMRVANPSTIENLRVSFESPKLKSIPAFAWK